MISTTFARRVRRRGARGVTARVFVAVSYGHSVEPTLKSAPLTRPSLTSRFARSMTLAPSKRPRRA